MFAVVRSGGAPTQPVIRKEPSVPIGTPRLSVLGTPFGAGESAQSAKNGW